MRGTVRKTATTGTANSYRSLDRLDLAGESHLVHRIDAVPGAERLPLSHKILLENLLRHEDGAAVTAEVIAALVTGRRPGEEPAAVSFSPSRVLLHDTNGVPVLADLAALREAVAAAGGDPRRVSSRIPSHLTVDHSVAVEVSGRPDAFALNTAVEYERNAERYRFLKWGERLDGLRVVPPGTGIMHQVNIEYLASVVERRDGWAFPDTLAGTDSHTTMVSALGVLAWGVGGIEAEAALLGLPIGLLVPPVVGVELTGAVRPGVTATDVVLTVVERLRAHGVVGKVVEFTGDAVAGLPLSHRATISNMAPEYGATTGLFPIDGVTLDYLRLTGRDAGHVTAVETYAKEQGLWHGSTGTPHYDEHVRVDLDEVVPSLAGPRRPQDRVPLQGVPDGAARAITEVRERRAQAAPVTGAAAPAVPDGAVVIAAITSCTNTSNPHVMVAAGLLARNARERGLTVPAWVKTSLAPGSRTVTDYLARAGLAEPLAALGFDVVGYGCMTCIGNSGPLLPVAAGAAASGAVLASVLSGNRNFDGRINNDVALNYLASPPLVVAYALAGTLERDLTREPLGTGSDGRPVTLAEIWPGEAEIERVVGAHLAPELFTAAYEGVFDGDEHWRAVPAAAGDLFDWEADSTYLRRPPFLDGVNAVPEPARDITGARALMLLGDSVTTDHISPAGRIPAGSVAGRHLAERGVTDLNTYASRRGNHEVMMRGGFANPLLPNALATGGPGAVTPDATGALVPVHEAARSYARAGVPLLVVAGREYGTGSSRDWAAKTTALLGVRAVLARSFERIHRSNLVQLGVLPLQFDDGDDAASLGLDGTGEFDLLGVEEALRTPSPRLTVRARPRTAGREPVSFGVTVRLDTAQEAEHYAHGGILPYVYRRLMADAD